MGAKISASMIEERLPLECERVAAAFRPNVVGTFLAHASEPSLLSALFGEGVEFEADVDTSALYTRAWSMVREAEEVFYGQH